MTQNHIESMEKALRSLQISDHIVYITYPMMLDKRLLLKALETIYEAIVHIINSILQYEYLLKYIELYKNPSDNFLVFKEKCAKKYNISETEMEEITELLSMAEKHKRSPLEFSRKDKIIIMSDNLKTNILDIIKIKHYLILSKSLLERVNSHISQQIN